ncbi:MAG TPA: peptidylprolyl isomerase [Candidatus Rifleibacterium sp.]|nr:peptidylprolyl isomerase [Candidatus Rifleibacterium sp.]HPT45324.1 peptidylprolyl isomerase [Candidatus Rifleibacterium sp.]
MFEKIRVVENHAMLLVSKRAVFMFIGVLLLMTTLLMTFFLWADFDYILGRRSLAMKVGQTSISLADLKKIQQLSGIQARQLSEAAFASDFFMTLLLAEGGRQAALDRQPAFLKKIADFDAALKNSTDDETVARAAFLIEELAEAFRQKILTQADDPGEAANAGKPHIAPPPPRVRLHLRTILASDASAVAEIMNQHAGGLSFAELNASYSVSLYKSLGGDLGWKSADDFPAGVFDRLLAVPVGSISNAFSDENGTHIFEIIARPGEDPKAAERATREQLLRESNKRRMARAMIDLRSRIDYWINPVIQVKCQVSPGAEPAGSGQNP